MWQASSFTDDTVTISPSDARYCTNCYYYMAVSAYSSTCTFTIVSRFGNTTVLQDGMSQNGRGDKGEMVYYSARVNKGMCFLSLVSSETPFDHPTRRCSCL